MTTAAPIPMPGTTQIRMSLLSFGNAALLLAVVGFIVSSDHYYHFVRLQLLLPIALLFGITLVAATAYNFPWTEPHVLVLRALGAGAVLFPALVTAGLPLNDVIREVVFWIAAGEISALVGATATRVEGGTLPTMVRWLFSVWLAVTTVTAITQSALVVPLATGRTDELRTLLLDLRVLTGVAFMALILYRSVRETLAQGRPAVAAVSLGRLSPAPNAMQNTVRVALAPAIVIINGLVAGLEAISTAIWRGIATAGIIAYRLGMNIGSALRQIIVTKPVLLGIARVHAAVLLIIFALGVTIRLTPFVVSYIRSEAFEPATVLLLSVLWRAVLVFVCLLGAAWLLFVGEREQLWSRVGGGLSVFVLLLIVVSLIMLALSQVETLAMRGFTWPGPLSAALFVLALVGVVMALSTGETA